MALLAVLILGGLAVLASASGEVGQIKFNDSYYYLKHQVFRGLSLGLLGFFIGYFLNYQRIKKLALPLLCVNLVLLAMVFIPKFGLSSGGASRWLQLGPMSFQPAELLKLSFIIYLSAWLTGRTNRTNSFWNGFFPFMVVSGITAGLLFLQPATSTVVILLFSGVVVYF